MRAFRVIFLTSLLFFLAGGAFAESNPGGRSQGGKSYSAPDFDFSGPMKTELLLIVVGTALLLARGRGGRTVSQTFVVADEPRYTVKIREVVGAEAAPETTARFIKVPNRLSTSSSRGASTPRSMFAFSTGHRLSTAIDDTIVPTTDRGSGT